MKIREIISQQIAKRGKGEPEPFDIALFTINMAGLINVVCVDLASSNIGSIILDGKKVGSDARDPSSVADIINIINGEDMMRNWILTRQIIDFFNYFLDQNEPDENDVDIDGAPLFWCDMTFILDKWNEYAHQK